MVVVVSVGGVARRLRSLGLGPPAPGVGRKVPGVACGHRPSLLPLLGFERKKKRFDDVVVVVVVDEREWNDEEKSLQFSSFPSFS